MKQGRPGSEARCHHQASNRSITLLFTASPYFRLTSSRHVPPATAFDPDRPCQVTASQSLDPGRVLHSILDCYHQWAESIDSNLAVRYCSHRSTRLLGHIAPAVAGRTEVAGAGSLGCTELDHGPRAHDLSSLYRSEDLDHDGGVCGPKCSCKHPGQPICGTQSLKRERLGG